MNNAPRAAVVVSTYNRAAYLPELLACLDAQTVDGCEIVIVDNGSTDETPLVLADANGVRVVRLDVNRGPGGGRNAGVAATRAPIVVMTDDDCLPTRHWVERLLSAFDDPAVVVAQGRVEPDPAMRQQMGPFDHTISVQGPTPFFETCNVAYRRSAFDAVGGFDENDALLQPLTGRAFGEDALLGAAVLRAGGARAFVDDAVVVHRCVARTFGQHLADQRQLRLFPALSRRTPLLQSLFYGRIFLSRTTALFDLGVLGVITAATFGKPALVLATAPWLVRRVRTTRWYGGSPRVLAKYAVSDAVTFWSLLIGSIRHRRLLL